MQTILMESYVFDLHVQEFLLNGVSN